MNSFKIFYTIAIFIFSLIFLNPTLAQKVGSDYVEGEILVKYKKGLSDRSIGMIHQQTDSNVIKKFPDFGVELVKISPGMTVEEAIKRYRWYPKVEIAEPNYYLYASATTPNDTNFSNLWGLNNTGQPVNGTSGTSDADIDAPEAWDTSTGSTDVVIAVIDTGVDYNHEDLSANIWSNSGETAANNIDDDNNGYIDDTKGWDFVNSDNDPADDHNHGSFISGIIGAVGNNSKGVCGVNWSVKIMPLKILDSNGAGTTADAISGINYAKNKNVKIINASWGGTSSSDTLKDAIDNSGALFMTGAGNGGDDNIGDGWDVDVSGQAIYPASYTSSNILAVAASDQDDNMPSFSNYGSTSIDVAAPGENIYSCNTSDTYAFADGTSNSTAYVSGIAGLLLAVNSNLTVSQLWDEIVNSVDIKSSLNGKVASGGRVNLNNAISSPSAPSNLTLSVVSSSQIDLSWADNSNNELGFKIERKQGAAGTYAEIYTASKNSVSYSDTGLSSSTTYYYRVRAYNNIGNSSYSGEQNATTSAASGGGGGGGGGGCFIATAVYGSAESKDVELLCEFRDRYLYKTVFGRALIVFYYKASPPIAKIIKDNRHLRALTKFFIKPIVWAVRLYLI